MMNSISKNMIFCVLLLLLSMMKSMTWDKQKSTP